MKRGVSALGICALCVALSLRCSEDPDTTDYRRLMRDFVQQISAYAKARSAAFVIIPQNGPELCTVDGNEDGFAATDYLDAIDGVGREDLYYGYDEDDEATPPEDITYLEAFLDIAEANGVEALVTDYCATPSKMADSYARNAAKGYTRFAADSRELDRIPTYPSQPYGVHAGDVTTLAQAKNFLYLLCPDNLWGSKQEFLNAIDATEYDAFIIDAFWAEEALTAAEVSRLKTKPGGGQRLVIAYMSIGEAEDYRFYWQDEWYENHPSWMAGENPSWPGNYKVRYWDESWQGIIFGQPDSYLDRILAAGFDGVYLDIIDAFEYFENAGEWWHAY
ncbi:MAG: hypothetical protein GF331_07705 [Chitinivibrionales bacterium]|nr:hypothetical protein [Chitinivibrionales bacterium]